MLPLNENTWQSLNRNSSLSGVKRTKIHSDSLSTVIMGFKLNPQSLMFYIHDYDTLEVTLTFNEVGLLGYELNKDNYIYIVYIQ